MKFNDICTRIIKFRETYVTDLYSAAMVKVNKTILLYPILYPVYCNNITITIYSYAFCLCA